VSGLRIPDAAVAVITDDVLRHGRQGLETGAFLLAEAEDPDHVRIVALLGTAGIQRLEDKLVISGTVLARLFDWAEEAGLVVRAQIHSHRFEAWMSPTDERFGLTVEGFTSAIVPDSSAPSALPGHWGWWLFTSGRWISTDAAELTVGTAQVVCVDEGGVDG
jgi:hypothetical protein